MMLISTVNASSLRGFDTLLRMTISPAQINVLIEAYARGLDTPEAAALAGIGVRTVSTFLTAPENQTHRDTAQRIRSAQATFADSALSAITASHTSDWRSAAWTLEHAPATRERYSDRGAGLAEVAVSGLFAALTAASTEPPRLGAAVDALPLLTDVTDVREVDVREVEE